MSYASHTIVPLSVVVALGCTADRVRPGFYGEPPQDDGALAAMPPEPNGSSSAGAAAPSPVMMSFEGLAGDAETAPTDSVAMLGGGGDPCDLSGRWLATLHYVTEALGQQQTTHTWLYYEIERTADGLEVARGLHCGQATAGVGGFAVQASFASSRAAGIERIRYDGQSVTSTPSADGCRVEFGKWYVVHGATTPHYTDPSIPLPTVDQPAAGMTPGWEDWDEDGQPGITSSLSGTVTGRLFMAPRVWIAMSGSAPEAPSRLRLAVDWNQEQNVLAIDGSPLLLTQGVRAANPDLHFAELVRVPDDQATGDAHAICEALVKLAPTWTPDASAI